MYFRDDGVRDGFLFRVQSAVCLLSEPSYCGDGERKSDFDRAAFGYFLELQAQNANNINLVTPSHYVLQIREALLLAKEKGLTVPVVYNCGGYESVEALQALDGLIDIYLPDFKYSDAALAKELSALSLIHI